MTAKYDYSLSFILPGFLLPSLLVKCDSILSVIHTVWKEKPQSYYVNDVDGVASLVEVISSRFVYSV